MTLRYYANAPATTLSASCTNVDTTIQVASTAGLPIQYPYTLILDRELSTEEAVSVTNAAGTTLTVTRGIDGTTAFAHSNGAEVVHGITAQDIREANAHVNATSDVHGVTGDLVGETSTQTLTNKDLSSGTNTFPSSLATDAEVTAAVDAAEATAAADLATHAADTSTHGVATVAGLSESQTLTNKTLALGSNTVSGTKAQFNAAMTDADFATLDGTETLTNKTLVSPDITGTATMETVTVDTNLDVSGSAAFTGTMYADQAFQSSVEVIGISDSSDTSLVVTFDTPFVGLPTVTVTQYQGSSGFYFVWAEDVDSTGFTLKSRKSGPSGAGMISVAWQAIVVTQ